MGDYSRRVMLQILGAAAMAGCGSAESDEPVVEIDTAGGAGGGAGQPGQGGAGHGGAGHGGEGGVAGHGGAEQGGAGHGGQGGAGGKAGEGGAGGKAGEGGAGGKAGEAGAGGKGEAGAGGKGEAGAGGKPEPAPTAAEMLAEIDTFVVVMMENRSFDHFFGALQRDKAYVNESKVDGTSGKESNPYPGHADVKIYKADTYALESPPHSFAASHKQYNSGKNDHFVIAGAASKADSTDTGNTVMAHPKEVMAYYNRTQIPFYYWLADNFTLCDNWHASVMGPTFPNRAYVNAGTSEGMEGNTHVAGKSKPIWGRLKAAKKSGYNYYGSGPLYSKIFVNEISKSKINPSKKIAEFFSAAKAGKLPHVSYIEPDYGSNSDHPEHDIRKGQLLVSTIYQALASSPQWKKCLMIVIYDEHGGFYDHVPPPKAEDDDPDFRRFGFRIPALVIGPTVKKGHLSHVLYDHTSVIATLADRYDLPTHGAREKAAHTLADVFDPALYNKPAAAPEIPKSIKPKPSAALWEGPFVDSQPELTAAIEAGEIPEDGYDSRPPEVRQAEMIQIALDLGVLDTDF